MTTESWREIIPWHRLIESEPIGITRNTDMSLSCALRYQGLDAQITDDWERLAVAQAAAAALQMFGTGWYMHHELASRPCDDYPDPVRWPVRAARLIDDCRRRQYAGESEQLANHTTVTLTSRFPGSLKAKFGGLVIKGESSVSQGALGHHLDMFKAQLRDFASFLAAILPGVQLLDGDGLLRHYHNAISTEDQYIDSSLHRGELWRTLPTQSLSPGIGGLSVLGDEYFALTTLTTGLNGGTFPQVLDQIGRLPFALRKVTVLDFIDKPAAANFMAGKLNDFKRATRSPMMRFENALLGSDGGTDNAEAESEVESAREAHAMLAKEGMVRMRTTVMVRHRDPEVCKEMQRDVRKAFSGNGFGYSVIDETWRSHGVWRSMLPGETRAGRRGVEVSAVDAANIIGLSGVYTGEYGDEHLAKTTGALQPHFYATKDKRPYRAVLADRDVSIGLRLGKTGSGKSTGLGFEQSQALRNPRARLFSLEKGNAGIGACMAHEGTIYRLGEPGAKRGLQPLADCATEIGRARSNEWLRGICLLNGLHADGHQLEAIDSVVQDIARRKPHGRTMTEFSTHIVRADSSRQLAPIFKRYAEGGEYGYLFDGAEDIDLSSHWISFQLGLILERPSEVKVPALMCIFNAIERSTGQHPTFLYFDEAHAAFEDEWVQDWFVTRIRTARARQLRIQLVTQDIGSFMDQQRLLVTLASALSYEIYGADPGVLKPNVRELYSKALNLSDREIEIIGNELQQSRGLYVRKRLGARVIPMELEPVALALSSWSEQDDLDFLARIEMELPKEGWLEAMLVYKRDQKRTDAKARDAINEAMKELHAWKSEAEKAA